MSSTEYATYANDKNKKWCCVGEVCVKPENTLETKLDLILNKSSTTVTKDEKTKMADSIKTFTAEVKHVCG